MITCANDKQFFDAVYQLTVKGLQFEADYDKLVIKLTGGY